jgi:hypothetical protein
MMLASMDPAALKLGTSDLAIPVYEGVMIC